MMNGSASCTARSRHPGCTTPAHGICPAGWHIPSQYELTSLEQTICTSGMCATDSLRYYNNQLAWNRRREQAERTGTTHWISPNTDTNTTVSQPSGGTYSYGFSSAGS